MAKKKTKIRKPTARKKKSPVRLVSDQGVWPLERDVLFRPDRMRYVRKLIRQDGCVFCAPAKEKPCFETLCVHQTEFSMVVLNKYPYNSGHILVLPKRHVGDILDLKPEEWWDLCDLKRHALDVVRAVYEPAGFNVGLNLGAVAGAGIPEHLHFHVIPRWAGDLNFFPLIAETKVVVETLEISYARLSEGFKSRGHK